MNHKATVVQNFISAHEAGHAVVALIMGIQIDHAFMSTSGERSRCARCNEINYGHVWIPQKPSPEQMLTLLAAGAIAEREFNGYPMTGNNSDKQHMHKILKNTGSRWKRIFMRKIWLREIRHQRRMTQICAKLLIKHNSDLIAIVSTALQDNDGYLTSVNLKDIYKNYLSGSIKIPLT